MRIRKAILPKPGVLISEGDFVGIGDAAIVIGDAPPDTAGADVRIGGRQRALHLEASSNGHTMIAGGEVGEFSGRLDHRPGADGSTFGYSRAGDDKASRCKCGFNAYKAFQRCNRCGQPLRWFGR